MSTSGGPTAGWAAGPGARPLPPQTPPTPPTPPAPAVPPAPPLRPAASRARRWWATTWWRSAAWGCAATLSSMIAAATWDARHFGPLGPDGALRGLSILLVLAGIALAVASIWRREHPVALTVGASLVTLALPLDPLVVLIGLMHLVRTVPRRRWRLGAAAGALAVAATALSTWRDTRGRTHLESFWRMVVSDTTDLTPAPGPPFAWWVPVLITVLLVGVFGGVGALRRVVEGVKATGEGHRVVAEHLEDEVARQAERERLAREVHDVLGHRLSLLSIHAGALETTTGALEGQEALARSATLVRESAQRTAQDLRSLLSVLREPVGGDLAATMPGLADIAALVDESVAHGMPVISTVTLESAAHLEPHTGQTAYRVLQELLTNARRHAPGVGVRVLLVARPEDGVRLEVANRMPAHGRLVPGSGLRGVSERVAQVGGESRVWVDDDGVLRAAVHLPWRWQLAKEAT